MEMPLLYNDGILGIMNSSPLHGTTRRAEAYSIVYPPVGFFPFLEIGNGDYHGFYWPIGQEAGSPLVAFSSHDAYALIPEHGDLASFGRCRMARSDDDDYGFRAEIEPVFQSARESLPVYEGASKVQVDDHRQLLALDPVSPFRNCAVGDLQVTAGEFDGAEQSYRRAIDRLPEYRAAHFGLASLLRRLQRHEEASLHLRKSLICPWAFAGGCFWADHILPGKFRNDWPRKALMWLQTTRKPHESLLDDPFVKRAGELTLKSGVAESRDLDLFIAMTDIYAAKEAYTDAIYMWILVGDCGAMETTSFRQRYGLTPRTFARRLSELLRVSGNTRRASLVDSVISAMTKPDGLHL